LYRFADQALDYIRTIQKKMHEASEPCNLYAVHGHYADAGEAAALMAHTLAIPMVFTGHSLGRNKLDHLKQQVCIPKTRLCMPDTVGMWLWLAPSMLGPLFATATLAS
jgi:hypothetical protein